MLEPYFMIVLVFTGVYTYISGSGQLDHPGHVLHPHQLLDYKITIQNCASHHMH